MASRTSRTCNSCLLTPSYDKSKSGNRIFKKTFEAKNDEVEAIFLSETKDTITWFYCFLPYQKGPKNQAPK